MNIPKLFPKITLTEMRVQIPEVEKTIGYLECEITPDGMQLPLSGDSIQLIEFLRENGIEFKKQEIDFCG
jgi:hypothetical protein